MKRRTVRRGVTLDERVDSALRTLAHARTIPESIIVSQLIQREYEREYGKGSWGDVASGRGIALRPALAPRKEGA